MQEKNTDRHGQTRNDEEGLIPKHGGFTERLYKRRSERRKQE